jgi:hypothetical protein
VKEPSFGQLAKRLEQRLEQRGASTWRSLGAAEESSEPVESTPSLQLEAQPASTGFEVGAVLCERFRIERCVLRGEGEEWFSAFDLMLEESVSLQRCIGVDAATQKRVLRRQLELARRSRSAHVCRVHDYAVWRGRTPEDDVPFLTAEPLSGENLSQRVFRGALPWAELRPIAEQILLALIDLHAAGLAHGALCARNVWLREDRDGPCGAPGLRAAAQRRAVAGAFVQAIRPRGSERVQPPALPNADGAQPVARRSPAHRSRPRCWRCRHGFAAAASIVGSDLGHGD